MEEDYCSEKHFCSECCMYVNTEFEFLPNLFLMHEVQSENKFNRIEYSFNKLYLSNSTKNQCNILFILKFSCTYDVA